MSYSKNIFSLEDGFKCFWTIGDFVRCEQSIGLTLESLNFYVDMLLESEWHLNIHIFPYGFCLNLLKDQGLSLNTNLHYSLYLLTSNGWTALLMDCQYKFQAGGEGNGLCLDWNTIYNGTLTICFHMWNGATRGKTAQCVMTSKMINEVDIFHLPNQEFSTLTLSDFSNFPTLSYSKFDPKVKTSDKSMQADLVEDCNIINDLDDLLRLFKEKKFRYVILRTQSKEFAVQKALLCARSPVFKAMFDKDMKENVSNTVDIEDIDSETLSLLLQFLHFEPLGDLKWDSAIKLFYAADKYQIMQLKTKCISSLKKELTEENVCDVLVLADMHHEKELMQSALEFFCKKSKSIIRSSEWKKLTMSRTELASEILCEMAERLVNSNRQIENVSTSLSTIKIGR